MLQGLEPSPARPLAREVKFLVSSEVAAGIVACARRQMAPDPHGTGQDHDQYIVTSLYMDTPKLDVYHRRGSYGRGKYRVRRYGTASDVFLERKLRTSRVLIKRRTAIGMEQLASLAHDGLPAHTAEGWFLRRLQARGLVPTCQVTYRRVARIAGTGHGAIRLTCDCQIQARQADGMQFNPDPGQAVEPNWHIVELKFQQHLPAIFRRLAAEFALEPCAVSKYRLSLEALGGAGVTSPPIEVDSHA